MTWLPTHGCALPLPKRNHAKYGVRQHGPKPSQMLKALQSQPHLMWIYLSASPDGGAEAVADYLLARLEIGVRAHELKRTMQLLRQCQSWMSGRPGAKVSWADLVKAAEQQHKEQEKAAAESWEKCRAAIIQRDQERRAGVGNQVKQRVAAAPKPAVRTLHRQRLERTLKATPAPEPMTIAPAPETKPRSHSRKPKGECGVKLGRKLDKLIAEIQSHEASCESSCCAAPVAVMERPPEQSSVDPPVPASGGGAERAPDDSAAGGSGFTNQGSVWDVMSGQGELLTDLRDFLGRLDSEPRLRASANLRTMSRVREHLERIPELAAMGDPVELRLQDVLVLMNQLMARMR